MVLKKYINQTFDEMALVEALSLEIKNKFNQVKHLSVFMLLKRKPNDCVEICDIKEFDSYDMFYWYFASECTGTAHIQIFFHEDKITIFLCGLKNVVRNEVSVDKIVTAYIDQNIEPWEPMTREEVREAMDEIRGLVNSVKSDDEGAA
jgi:hypothetical protein